MMQPVRPSVLRGLLVGGLWVLAVLGTAQTPATGPLLTVSKPPASLLPTDPPQGLVYASPTDLASAELFFSAEGGPVDLAYLVFDSRGDGYLTFDDGPDVATGGVIILNDLASRKGGTFDPARDRLITGGEAGLVEPKDLALAEGLGLVIVADFAAADLKVFDTLNTEDVAPIFITTDLGQSEEDEPRRPWGVAYDEAADQLFVGATDGTLLVYDGYLTRQGEAGPDRVVTPTLNGQKVSHNLHELVYLPETDTVVATDVGAATTADQPGFDSDGSLLVLEGANRADGATPVKAHVHGEVSLLGNPVGLVRQGESVFVAENARDLVLRFDGLLSSRGHIELAPDAAVSVVKPESVVLAPMSNRTIGAYASRRVPPALLLVKRQNRLHP